MTRLAELDGSRTGAVRPWVRAAPMPPGVVAVWCALFLNVLTFLVPEAGLIVPIPLRAGQLVTQAALVLALMLALLVNRRHTLRPSLFLVMLTMLAVVSVMVSIHNEFALGSTFRAVRFLAFTGVLWLLTPWWGRPDMLLLRCHRRALWVVLASVLLGALIAPNAAFSFEGRLMGVLWPILPTQVAHYAGILLGTSVVLWMCRVITTRHALTAATVTATILILTHTRTALLATVIALALAGASLLLGHVRVRRAYAVGAVVGTGVIALFTSELTSWLMRGQTPQEAGQLTGRTKVWSAALNHPRTHWQELFGSGMSDQSFNGLAIDSSWVATYLDQGWFGLVMQASLLLMLLLMAVTHVRGPQRAVALFLIVYVLVSSFFETGLGTTSTYMLDLAVASSLLAPSVPGRSR